MTMADDGMFLNFSVDESLASAGASNTQKFKGGSWRDRLRAKRSAQRGQRGGDQKRRHDANTVPISQGRFEGRTKPHTHGDQSDEFPDARPVKRRRENGHVTDSAQVQQPAQRRGNEQRPTAGPREVISSLFTYNPKPSTAVEEPKEDKGEEKPTAPSNAPLIDGIDTFTSLGLSPTIATHLLTKMNLKNPTAIQKAAVSQMLKDDSDAFIQSETGSGKTLAYLLPLVQRIMTMSEQVAEKHQNYTQDPLMLHRDSGLFAIILAPTRELCKQISVVLERLLGCAHYIVAGHVIGGEKKKSEKARMRKGLNVLVATPGRLVDHLENTKALDVSNVRWLVLDEGDRLMDLGFEEDITKIVKTLDQKKRPRGSSKWPGLPEKRTTVLCSATLKMNVQKLGEISLKDAVLIKGDPGDDDALGQRKEAGDALASDNGTRDSTFLAPAQLKQSYIVAAAKLRFVTLTALLKRTFARKGSVMKAIVFVSCADSVEFHFKAFTTAFEGEDSSENKEPGRDNAETDSETEDLGAGKPSPTSSRDPSVTDSILPSPILSSSHNQVTLYKLHGSLPQITRTNIVKAFAATTAPSLLVATDVASRGLDLPNLDLVIEYDPAFSAEDHLHRIGRTARLGRDGRAIIFLLPGKEEGYVSVLKSSYKTGPDTVANVSSMSADEVLKRGFAPLSGVIPTKNKNHKNEKGADWQSRATDRQLSLERFILSSPQNKDLAKRAFQSHVRAYATHIASERKWFDIKELHLGHLCKSFGLRETPSGMGVGRNNKKAGSKRGRSASDGGGMRHGDGDGERNGERPRTRDADAAIDNTGDADEAARKMREKIRMNRKMMMGGTADEFNIA
ncbi:Helicase conserved domain-containing protein [Cladophialophora immunda]|nr:Helicase conserved domain-containing protein [Cladophialophora immunda]